MLDFLGDPGVGGLIALVSLIAATVISLWAWRRPRAARPKDGELTAVQLAELLDSLSRKVERQWRAELPRRGVDPVAAQLAVRAGHTETAQVVSSLEVSFAGAFTGTIRGWNLSGRTVTTAAADFLTLPSRQLVVLGKAGAGKSILAALLARDLQQHRAELGGRVPILLPAATWRPDREVLETWLAHTIGLDYGVPPRTAARLVTEARIMLILDGLDENPDPAEAMRQLHLWAQRDTPFVVTCRNRQFLDAYTDIGHPLAAAAVVELLPLTAGDVIDYLDPRREPRWAALRDRLTHAGSPAAEALSNPLMVGLARHRYQDPGTDPGELAAMSTTDEVSRHLLDQFIPAAFSRAAASTLDAPLHPLSRRQTRKKPIKTIDPGDARTWLAWLARHLNTRQTTTIA